jgi:hypothetical protein
MVYSALILFISQPSILWVSFDDFRSFTGLEDVDISITETALSIDIPDVVNKAGPVTGGESKKVKSNFVNFYHLLVRYPGCLNPPYPRRARDL